MEILLTGFTAFLTQEWIETAFPDDHVLTTHAKGEALQDTRIKTVMLESKQLLDQLTETYQFDRVVYFLNICCHTGIRKVNWTVCAGCCNPAASGRWSCCTSQGRKQH